MSEKLARFYEDLQTSPVAPEAKTQRKRVVVADDSLTMCTLLKKLLLGMGFEVSVALDGKAALEAVAAMESCDLLVTDMEMPRMDGVELCRSVRRSRHPNLPIIMVTAVNRPDRKRAALDAGADVYIVKGDFEQTLFLEQVVRFTGPV